MTKPRVCKERTCRQPLPEGASRLQERCDSCRADRIRAQKRASAAKASAGLPAAIRACLECHTSLGPNPHSRQLRCPGCSEERRREWSRNYKRGRSAGDITVGAWRSEVRECLTCSTEFKRGDRTNRAVTCSDECQTRRERERALARIRERQIEAAELASRHVPTALEADDWAVVFDRIAASSGAETAARARESLERHRQLAGAA